MKTIPTLLILAFFSLLFASDADAQTYRYRSAQLRNNTLSNYTFYYRTTTVSGNVPGGIIYGRWVRQTLGRGQTMNFEFPGNQGGRHCVQVSWNPYPYKAGSQNKSALLTFRFTNRGSDGAQNSFRQYGTGTNTTFNLHYSF